MGRSFAFKLAVAFAMVAIAAAALTALLVNVAFGTRFTDYLEAQQRGRQADLVRSLQDSYDRMNGWDGTDLKSLSALALSDGGELRLMDVMGNVIWEPSATPAGRAMTEMHREMLGGGPLGPERTIPVVVNGERVATMVVRVPEPGLSQQDLAFRSSVNGLLLLGGVIACLFALGLGVILARRATAPARDLTRAAQALAAGDRSRRVTVDSTTELGEMGEAFNTMAGTIEEEDRLRRIFATDVAHELRTPLAILRTQVEALQDGVSDPSPQVFSSLHEETLRLTRLVEDLETLASAEAARFSLQPRDVEMKPLVEAVAKEFAGPYDSKEVRLETDLDDVLAFVDPTRVGQIVSNLLSNALKFTPSRQLVRLSLRKEEADAVIEVADSGGGIPADEIDHVFDRFYRGRDTRTSGSGIGLTVVRELTQAHGGSVEVASERMSGTRFTVRLPLSSPEPVTTFTQPSHSTDTVRGKGETP